MKRAKNTSAGKTPRLLGLYTVRQAADLLDIPEDRIRACLAAIGYARRYLTVPMAIRVWVELKPFSVAGFLKPHVVELQKEGKWRWHTEGRRVQEAILAQGGLLTPIMAQIRFATLAQATAAAARFPIDKDIEYRAQCWGADWLTAILQKNLAYMEDQPEERGIAQEILSSFNRKARKRT